MAGFTQLPWVLNCLWERRPASEASLAGAYGLDARFSGWAVYRGLRNQPNKEAVEDHWAFAGARHSLP